MLFLFGICQTIAATVVYLHATNNADADDSPFAWFLITLLFGLLGLLLYWALGPNGPLLRPISDEDVREDERLVDGDE